MTFLDLILSGKYTIAVGMALVAAVGLIRYGLVKLSPWFGTKLGGYVVAYTAALALYVGTSLQSGEMPSARLILTALAQALMSSGILDHWRDITQAATKSPGASAAAGAAVIFIFAISCAGTTPTGGSVTNAVVECTLQGQSVTDKIEAVAAEMGAIVLSADPDKWSKIEVIAINDGLTIGGCAISRVVNDWITKKSLGSPTAARETQLAHATMEDYRAKYANHASFRTKNGDM